MNLSSHHAALVKLALRRVEHEAIKARSAPDLDATRKALIAVRDACVDAADTLNDCERETREAALAKLEQAA